MNYHDIAYVAVECALINYSEQLDKQLENALSTYSKAEMLAPLGNDDFMHNDIYKGFTVERDHTKVTFVGLCNAYSGMFDTCNHKEEERFALQLGYQFKDYVESWFERRGEIEAIEGQVQLNAEHQTDWRMPA